MTKRARKSDIGLLVIVILVMAPCVYFASTKMEDKDKANLERAYEAIHLPQNLTLQSKSWVGGGSDVRSHWAYRYNFNGSPELAGQGITASVTAAGFTTVDPPQDFRSPFYATANGENVELYIQPQHNGSALENFDAGVAVNDFEIDVETKP